MVRYVSADRVVRGDSGHGCFLLLGTYRVVRYCQRATCRRMELRGLAIIPDARSFLMGALKLYVLP